MRHESSVRAFVRALVGDWNDVDEVMQEVSLVAWRKFAEYEPDTEFGRWVCVIARFEALKYRRSKARDRLVLDDSVLDLLAEEGLEEAPKRRREQKALDQCMAKLPRARQELLMRAYSTDNKIKDLAASEGKTEGALYRLLGRLRKDLRHCVEQTIKREAQA